MVRALVDSYPRIYLPLCRLTSRTRGLMVRKDTELVIESFPRSANTFAVVAFTLAQGRPVKLAHHLHAPAQVKAAVRMRIPTLVLIRKPRDAIVSLLVRAPHIPAEQALKDYIRFYTSILPYRDRFAIACFQEVTEDFGCVVQRVNAHFGTDFSLFEHTAENVKRCFLMVEQMDKEDTKLERVQEETVARPSRAREELKSSRIDRFTAPRARELLSEAERVYDAFVQGQPRGGGPQVSV